MAEDTESAQPDDAGTTRRTLLKGAAIGAGALWVAPAVLSFDALPAAASPAGCELCGQQIPINGAGNSLTGWNPVPAIASWSTTGTVFEATGQFGTLNRRERAIYDFSPACISRFNQPPSTQPSWPNFTFVIFPLPFPSDPRYFTILR